MRMSFRWFGADDPVSLDISVRFLGGIGSTFFISYTCR